MLYSNAFGNLLRENRGMFLSAKAKHTFTGYAFAQAKRMKNHKEWHDNPPSKPARSEYNLPEGKSLMDHSQIMSIDKEFGFNKDKNPSSDTRELVAQKHGEEKASAYFYEKKWRVAMRNFDNYLSWKETRNKERMQTELDHGFDVKNAYHLIRLLRMGKEILTEGKVYVKRPDAKEILEIRKGLWSYEKVLEEADRLEVECNEIYNKRTYIVPHGPDINKIDALCMDILRENFRIP